MRIAAGARLFDGAAGGTSGFGGLDAPFQNGALDLAGGILVSAVGRLPSRPRRVAARNKLATLAGGCIEDSESPTAASCDRWAVGH